MQIGNAPCSWGVERSDDPMNPPWEVVLDECAAAGYAGIDLGPVGFFPEDVALMRESLASRRLALTSAVLFQPFHDPAGWASCLEATHRSCRMLQALGGRQLVLIDAIAPERAATLGRPAMAPRLDPQAWRGFRQRIEWAAQIAAEEYGLTASIHPHAGGYCDFEDEFLRLLEEVHPEVLSICIDTAHMTLAGMDPLAILRDHGARVVHVHLKDIDPVRKRRTIAEGAEFYAACADGLFCQIGAGEVDFGRVRQALAAVGYAGWCTVEQDCAPDSLSSKLDIIRANRQHLLAAGF